MGRGGAYKTRREDMSVATIFCLGFRRVVWIMYAERRTRAKSMAISTDMDVIQNEIFGLVSTRKRSHDVWRGKRTSNMHFPVHTSQGRGMSHPNTTPVMTASVHISTMTPTLATPTFCTAVMASLCRNKMVEHFVMLRTMVKRMVEAKTLDCI